MGCVNGHVKKGKYVSSHTHLNVAYLIEADETQKLKIKEDEISGVKWVNIEDVVKQAKDEWTKNVYLKLIDKLKKQW